MKENKGEGLVTETLNLLDKVGLLIQVFFPAFDVKVQLINVGQDHRVFESVKRDLGFLQRELKFEMCVLEIIQGLFGWIVLLERKVN